MADGLILNKLFTLNVSCECSQNYDILNICKFEFRLNCKQRLKFLPGPMSDNRFMSVDAA